MVFTNEFSDTKTTRGKIPHKVISMLLFVYLILTEIFTLNEIFTLHSAEQMSTVFIQYQFKHFVPLSLLQKPGVNIFRTETSSSVNPSTAFDLFPLPCFQTFAW